MYEYIQGKLVEKNPTYAVLETGGVAYKLLITLNTYEHLGDEEKCKLFTYFHVTEDQQTLFGFKSKAEREIFLLLISVSGIGPSTGRMVLSCIDPLELKDAIFREDVNRIKSIKGIGPKSAQRMILELKDKMGKLDIGIAERPTSNNPRQEALSALMLLGFGRNPAEQALDKVANRDQGPLSVENWIKEALRIL